MPGGRKYTTALRAPPRKAHSIVPAHDNASPCHAQTLVADLEQRYARPTIIRPRKAEPESHRPRYSRRVGPGKRTRQRTHVSSSSIPPVYLANQRRRRLKRERTKGHSLAPQKISKNPELSPLGSTCERAGESKCHDGLRPAGDQLVSVHLERAPPHGAPANDRATRSTWALLSVLTLDFTS